MPRFVLVIVSSIFALMLAVPSHATLSACAAGKKKCVAKKTTALLKCHALAEKQGLDPATDPTVQVCLQKARDKFDGGADPARGCFAKLEARFQNACVTENDAASLESKIDDFVSDVVTTLDPGYPSTVQNACAAGKKKCVSKNAAALLKCHAKNEKPPGMAPADFAACLQKANAKFDGGADLTKGCFYKLEARFSGLCLTTGDTATLETKVGAFVGDATCTLDPGPDTCGACFAGTPTPTAIPTPVATATAGAPCPTTFEFTANGPASDLDEGWTGMAHDLRLPTGSRLTLAVAACASTVRPCGQCSTSGPVANAGGPEFANRRCRGADNGTNGSWVQCTSDLDCPGTGNTCTYFFGPPQPIGAGGLSVCLTNEIEGAATGTIDVEAGSSATALTWRQTTHVTPGDFNHPCPRCIAGVCSGGVRSGQACTIQGTSLQFTDAVSLDCPPATFPAVVQMALQLATGTQTVTLGADSPNCSSPGFSGSKCFCSDGSGAGSKPNDCDDAVCSPNTPPDGDSTDEGVCAAGPLESFCAPHATYRGCVVDADCAAANLCIGGPNDGAPCTADSSCPCGTCEVQTCAITKLRECFAGSGVVGDTVSAGGVASPTAPTLSGFACMGSTSSGAVNGTYGLPGLMRITIPGTATLN